MSAVLVTGGSGFVGSHCILQLLAAGHTVRTTVRHLQREGDVRSMLQTGGAEPGDRLSFVAADLANDAGWADAVRGCEYVLHVASPIPPTLPKHEDELIVPAREGALRVLRAAREAGVKRVVLTSSFAAIGYGHGPRSVPYDETSWTNIEGRDTTAYVKSKTLAERAAWDFVEQHGGIELAVINPAVVLGPVLGPDYSPSLMIVQRLMDGAMPGCPQRWFGIVDVRDLAELHLLAMTSPAARGERFLAAAGDFLPMVEMARVLKARLGAAASQVPVRQLPNWLVRLAALRDPALRQVTAELGRPKNGTNAKARGRLGWKPRSSEDAIVASAQSLLRLGLLKASVRQAA